MTFVREHNKLQDELIKKMPGWQRLKIAFGLNDFARKIIRSDVKKNNPSISDKEADKLVADRFRK